MKSTAATLMAFLSSVSVSLATLTQGDVAIVRVNSSNDGFSLLALRDIPATEALFATDNGWLKDGGFRTGEGNGSLDIIGIEITRGTVIDITSGGGSFSLSTSGDQVILFTGTLANPSLLFAIDWDNTKGWDDSATSTTTSADPATAPSNPALSDRLTVSLGNYSSYRYKGIKVGTPDQLLDAIGNSENWETTSDTSWTGRQFTIVPEPSTWVTGFGLSVGLLGTFVRKLRR